MQFMLYLPSASFHRRRLLPVAVAPTLTASQQVTEHLTAQQCGMIAAVAAAATPWRLWHDTSNITA